MIDFGDRNGRCGRDVIGLGGTDKCEGEFSAMEKGYRVLGN